MKQTNNSAIFLFENDLWLATDAVCLHAIGGTLEVLLASALIQLAERTEVVDGNRVTLTF